VTSMHFIGLDIHKKTISYCVKDVSGKMLSEGTIPATRVQLNEWMKTLPAPWTVAMEATMFIGWIYDHLLPHAAAVKVAHPLMLRAIAAAKKKNDRIDASKICDCLRCDFLPECHMVSTEVRERRRTLRYRKLLVRQNVQLHNKVSQMLMESGVVYNKQKLHKVGYFKELMETNQDIGRALRPLLTICRETIVRIGKTESALIRSLRRDPLLRAVNDDPCGRSDRRADLGARGRRCSSIPLGLAGCQLLRSVRRRAKLGGDDQTHAHLQAEEQAPAIGLDRSSQAGAKVEP
jgi:transposase